MRIDYSPLAPPDVLGAVLDPVAASVSRFADAQIAKKRQERELALRREQEARLGARDDQRHADAVARQKGIDAENKARIELADRRQVGEAEARNARARAEVAARIRAAAAGGDEATAEMIDRAYAEADPRTGAVSYGIGDIDPQTGQKRRGFERVPGMAKPEAPTQEVAPTIDPVAMSLQGFFGQKKQEKFDQDTAAYEADQNNPRYRIGGVETSRDDLRHAQSGLDAADFDKYIGSTARPGDADGESYAKMLGSQVRGRGLSLQQGTAAWNDYLKTGRKMTFDAGENKADRESRERIGAMSANRPRQSSPTAERNVELRARKEFEDRVKGMAVRYDMPNNTKASLQMAEALKDAQSDNSVLQSAAQFGIAKEISGGGGASLSNKDVEAMAARAGGFERLKGMVDRFMSGQKLSEGEKKVLADAIRERMAAVAGRIQQFSDDYDATFFNPQLPWARELGEDYVHGVRNQYVPGAAQRQRQQQSAAPGAPGGDRIRLSRGPLPGAADAAGAVLQDDDDEEMDPDINSEAPLDASPVRPPAPQLVEGLPPGYVGSGRRQAARPTREQLDRAREEARRRGLR